jgi:hypothetical protein
MIDKKSFKWTMLFIFFMFASLTFGSKFQDRCHLCGKQSASLTEGCKKCKAQACMNCIRDMKLGKAEKDGNGQIKIIQGKNGQEIVRGPKTECHCKNWGKTFILHANLFQFCIFLFFVHLKEKGIKNCKIKFKEKISRSPCKSPPSSAYF